MIELTSLAPKRKSVFIELLILADLGQDLSVGEPVGSRLSDAPLSCASLVKSAARQRFFAVAIGNLCRFYFAFFGFKCLGDFRVSLPSSVGVFSSLISSTLKI